MDGLREGEERDEEREDDGARVERGARKDRPVLVPEEPVPPPLLEEREDEEGEKEERQASGRAEGERRGAAGEGGRRRPCALGQEDEADVRDTVNQDVRHGEGVVGVEDDDPEEPHQRRRQDDEGFPPRDGEAAPGPSRLLEHPRGEKAREERHRRAGDDGAEAGEKVPVDEPVKAAGLVGVPPEERREGGAVDDRRVENARDAPFLAVLPPVERHPAVLLPDEMEDGDVCQNPPEDERRERPGDDAGRIAGGRNGEVEDAPAAELVGVGVDAPAGRPDVRDVDEDDRGQPEPERRVALEQAGRVPDEEKEEGRGRRPGEEAEVDGAREEPGRAHRGAMLSPGARSLPPRHARHRPGRRVRDRDEDGADDERGARVRDAEEDPLKDGIHQDAHEEQRRNALEAVPQEFPSMIREKEETAEEGGASRGGVGPAAPDPDQDRQHRLNQEPEPARPGEALRDVEKELHREQVEASALRRVAQGAGYGHPENGERQQADRQRRPSGFHGRAARPPTSGRRPSARRCRRRSPRSRGLRLRGSSASRPERPRRIPCRRRRGREGRRRGRSPPSASRSARRRRCG